MPKKREGSCFVLPPLFAQNYCFIASAHVIILVSPRRPSFYLPRTGRHLVQEILHTRDRHKLNRADEMALPRASICSGLASLEAPSFQLAQVSHEVSTASSSVRQTDITGPLTNHVEFSSPGSVLHHPLPRSAFNKAPVPCPGNHDWNPCHVPV
jgi:hypothetical protein